MAQSTPSSSLLDFYLANPTTIIHIPNSRVFVACRDYPGCYGCPLRGLSSSCAICAPSPDFDTLLAFLQTNHPEVLL